MTTANKLMIAFAIVMLSLTSINCVLAYKINTAHASIAVEHDLIIKQNEVLMKSAESQMEFDKLLYRSVSQLESNDKQYLELLGELVKLVTIQR